MIKETKHGKIRHLKFIILGDEVFHLLTFRNFEKTTFESKDKVRRKK